MVLGFRVDCCLLPLLVLFEGNARIIPTAIRIESAAFHPLAALGRGRFWSSRRWRPTGAGPGCFVRSSAGPQQSTEMRSFRPCLAPRFQHRQWRVRLDCPAGLKTVPSPPVHIHPPSQQFAHHFGLHPSQTFGGSAHFAVRFSHSMLSSHSFIYIWGGCPPRRLEIVTKTKHLFGVAHPKLLLTLCFLFSCWGLRSMQICLNAKCCFMMVIPMKDWRISL